MAGWVVVDAVTNKSQPITGKTDSGATSPYILYLHHRQIFTQTAQT